MYTVMIPETENPQEAKSDRVSLIGINTLRRVHNVCFLVERLKCVLHVQQRTGTCSSKNIYYPIYA